MTQPRQRSAVLLLAAAALGVTLAPSASAQIGSNAPVHPHDWTWRVGINMWLPGVDATTRFQTSDGGTIGSEVDPGNYLKNLKFFFMGTVEARHGPWSILGDVVQLRFSDDESKVRSITGPGGAITVPIDSRSDTTLKGFVTTIQGGYAVMQSPDARMDVVAGMRYTKLKAELDWQLSGPAGGFATSGSASESKDLWDGVVGLRGVTALGGNWDFRYYADVGTGSSKLTWQALAGVGYRFKWGDVVVAYRHLAYELDTDRPVSDMTFSGPQFTVGFTF
jgi:hypothetical protein